MVSTARPRRAPPEDAWLYDARRGRSWRVLMLAAELENVGGWFHVRRRTMTGNVQPHSHREYPLPVLVPHFDDDDVVRRNRQAVAPDLCSGRCRLALRRIQVRQLSAFLIASKG